MVDYDTPFLEGDGTLGWFDWLFKPKATKQITVTNRLMQMGREINALIAKYNDVRKKINTNSREINALMAQARTSVSRASSLAPPADMGDDMLGWFDFIFKRKPKSVTAQIAALNKKRRGLFVEVRALSNQIGRKRAEYNNLKASGTKARAYTAARANRARGQQSTQQMSVARATARAFAVARANRARALRVAQQRAQMIAAGQKPFAAPSAPPVEAAMEGLSAAERKELLRRMRMGWAQRPGAPDMPGEASAMIASLSKYKYDLAVRIRNRLVAERRMGWAKRPGAPDMPGEAAAMFKKYGVTLGPERLAIDEELFV